MKPLNLLLGIVLISLSTQLNAQSINNVLSCGVDVVFTCTNSSCGSICAVSVIVPPMANVPFPAPCGSCTSWGIATVHLLEVNGLGRAIAGNMCTTGATVDVGGSGCAPTSVGPITSTCSTCGSPNLNVNYAGNVLTIF